MHPIQVSDASDRQRAKQRDTRLGGCRLRDARQMVMKVQGWGSRGARVQPIQVAAASDRRRARQRDTGLRGRGLGVLGCVRFRLLTPVTGNVGSSVTRD